MFYILLSQKSFFTLIWKTKIEIKIWIHGSESPFQVKADIFPMAKVPTAIKLEGVGLP